MSIPIDRLRGALGFATGGLVEVMRASRGGAPAFASGGSVPGRATINLTIGTDTFQGLLAPREVADKLVRYALNEQVRSAGKKPSWYYG